MPQFKVNARDTDGEYVEGIVIVSADAESAKSRMTEIGYTDIEEPELIAESAPVPEIQRLMDAMPGLIGGIDHSLIDHLGKPVPFVLVLFSGKTAVHATNFDGKQAMAALQSFASSLADAGDPDGNALTGG